MGADLFAQFPEEVAEANEIWDIPLRSLYQWPEEQLGKPNSQPALYLVSYLHAQAITKDEGKPAMAAGHSVENSAALAFAGAFTFSDGLKMVAKRGEIMSQVREVGWLLLLPWKQQNSGSVCHTDLRE